MDLADELARYGIEAPDPQPAPAPKLRDPWEIVREEYPGARIVRFIDLERHEQEFKPIANDVRLFDGMTIAYPSRSDGRSRTHEEWEELIARYDAQFHAQRASST